VMLLNRIRQIPEIDFKTATVCRNPYAARVAAGWNHPRPAWYEEVGEKMAMSIGGEKHPDALRRRHWERFASVEQMAAGLPALAAGLAEEQAQAFVPSAIVTRIADGVTARCRLALQEIGRTEEG